MYRIFRVKDDEGRVWVAASPGFRSFAETPGCAGVSERPGRAGMVEAIHQLWGLTRFAAPLDPRAYARA